MKRHHCRSRRQFLKQSGIAAMAALATSSSLPQALAFSNPWDDQDKPAEQRFKKAVKIDMVKLEGSLTDRFGLLKKLGFDGVELNSPSSLQADEVKRAIDETGLPVHGVVDSVHWQKTLSDPDEAVREAGLQGLLTAIRDSKAFGGTSVLLVPAVCNREVNYEQAWSRSIEQIKKAIPLAEELDIDILMENVWNNFLTDPAETARFIDELDSKKVGAYYDVGNSVRYAPPSDWIDKLGKRIRKLDIKEYDLELTKDGDWYAGFKAELLEGSCEWPVVMKKMKELGYSGWATAEIPGGDEKRLKTIAENMDRIFAS
jgi:hexulose-6-phosphate isomerase